MGSHIDFDEYMLERLANPKAVSRFLKVSIEDYMADGHTQAFMHALRLIAEAQGGIAQLAKKTHISRPNLYKILTGKTMPKLDTAYAIIRGLREGAAFTIDKSMEIDRRAAA